MVAGGDAAVEGSVPAAHMLTPPDEQSVRNVLLAALHSALVIEQSQQPWPAPHAPAA